MTEVFVDMDGVLAAFHKACSERGVKHPQSHRLMQGFVDKSGWTEDELEYDKQVKRLMSEPGFFENLPPIEGCQKLWGAAGKRRCILTARPDNHKIAERVSEEKYNWCVKNLGPISDDEFVCCLRADKKKYAKGNILVDDLEWNCREWSDNGGVAILFKNNKQAIRDLKKLV